MYGYSKERITYPDGKQADVIVARFPPESLTFRNIVLDNDRAKIRDAAHFRHFMARARGAVNPVIVAWACADHGATVAQTFPHLDPITETGEVLLNLNAFVTYTLRQAITHQWVRYADGTLQINPAAQNHSPNIQPVLDWLHAQNRLWLELGDTPPDEVMARINVLMDVFGVGRCGFVRDVVRAEMPFAAFNTSYFLLENYDFTNHHAMLGDAHGMMVIAGEVIRPPLYRRATLWCDDRHHWQTGFFDLHDVRISLPHDIDATRATIYTCYTSVAEHGRVLGITPDAPDHFELVIVDRQIVSWKMGGNLEIPQHGFVLSFTPDALKPSQIATLKQGGQVTYHLPTVHHAQQCGPLLLKDGDIALSETTFEDEQFWVNRQMGDDWVVGVVPTSYPADIDQTRAGRVGVGTDADSNLLAVAIPGVSKNFAMSASDSVGATLVELAEQMQHAGAVDAINMDGGGSSQMFIHGGLITQPGDRRGQPNLIYERMVPAIGLVRK